MGLDAPRLRVMLAMGSIVYRIVLGGAAPTPAGAAYAMIEGQGIEGQQLCVVPRDLLTELSRPGDVYRSRTLIPYLSSALAKISLESQTESRELVRGRGGGWAIVVGSQKVRADREALDRLLAVFADLTAEAFIGEEQAEQALAAADDKVRLLLAPASESAPRAVLSVGGTCPGHPEDAVAIRSEPLPKKTACVPKGVMQPLSMSASALADLHLFSLRPDEIESVDLTSGDKRLELARAGTGWHIRAPAEGAVDSEVGQAFARGLHDLTAEAIATPSAQEGTLSPPRGKATVIRAGDGAVGKPRAGRAGGEAGGGQSDDAARREEVEIGNEADGAVYVRRLADDVVLRCSPDVARQLSPTGPSLRSRKIIDVPIGRVRKVVIAAGEVRQVLSRSTGGGWTLEEPKSFAVDPGLAGDIAEELAELRADRWAAETDDGSYGFDSPRARYQLVLEGETIGVEVSRRTGRGSFARRADQPGVFVLPLATEQKLEAWAIDRSYFMIDPSEVRQIRIERGDRFSVLGPARSVGQKPGSRASESEKDESARAVERFEVAKRVLGEARAEGVVHLGRRRPEEGFDHPVLVVSVTKSSAPGGALSTLRMIAGRGDVFHDTNVFYLRRDDVDATFAIAQGKLHELLEMEFSPPSRPPASPSLAPPPPASR
jgi:hypothetical protein